MIKMLFLVVALLAGFLAVTAIGGRLYVTYTTTPMSWPVEEFSLTAWISAAPQERYVFYRDLAGSGRLDGATREQVIGLLGPPGFEASDGSYLTWVVKVAEPGEWSLDVRLDPATSKVRHYKIRGD